VSDRELLMRTLGRLSLEATPPQVDALLELTRELTFWAPQLGLSTLRDENVVLIRHVLDSLLLTPLVEPPSTLLDIGTGAGLPAVPLAIVWPQCQVVAMDSKRKSHWLVSRLATQLGLDNLQHACIRADAEEAQKAFAGQMSLVTCRGLARIDRALDLCRPFRAPGGCIAVLGGPDLDERPLDDGQELRTVAIPGADWRRRILLER